MPFLYHYYYTSMVANVSNKRVNPDQKLRWKTISFGVQKSKKLQMIQWIMFFLYESFKTSHFSEEHKATVAWPHGEVQIQKKNLSYCKVSHGETFYRKERTRMSYSTQTLTSLNSRTLTSEHSSSMIFKIAT